MVDIVPVSSNEKNEVALILEEKKLNPISKMADLHKEIEDAYENADAESFLESAKVRLQILDKLQGHKDKAEKSSVNNGFQILIPHGFAPDGTATFLTEAGSQIGKS